VLNLSDIIFLRTASHTPKLRWPSVPHSLNPSLRMTHICINHHRGC